MEEKFDGPKYTAQVCLISFRFPIYYLCTVLRLCHTYFVRSSKQQSLSDRRYNTACLTKWINRGASPHQSLLSTTGNRHDEQRQLRISCEHSDMGCRYSHNGRACFYRRRSPFSSTPIEILLRLVSLIPQGNASLTHVRWKKRLSYSTSRKI